MGALGVTLSAEELKELAEAVPPDQVRSDAAAGTQERTARQVLVASSQRLACLATRIRHLECCADQVRVGCVG